MAVVINERHVPVDVPVVVFNYAVHHDVKLTFIVSALGLGPFVTASLGFLHPEGKGMVLSVLFLGPGPELVVFFHLRLLKLWLALQSFVVSSGVTFHRITLAGS